MERQRSDLAHCRAYYEQDLHSDVHDAILSDDEPRNRWDCESRQRLEKQWSSRLDQRHAGYRLQLQQLDWERDRLLFGDNNPASITMNAPITENASFTRNTGTPTPTATATATATPTPTPTPTPTVQVTVQTAPLGLAFTVDGTTYSSTQTFSWARGSSHTISTISLQNGATGVRFVWSRWSDSSGLSHTVAPTTNTTYTATFTTQYYLTMVAGTGGTVSPTSQWKNSGATVSITATPTNNTQVSYSFSGWTGSGTGFYSGTNNPASITMNGPITENAAFTQNPVQVTVQTNQAGRTLHR